MKDACVLQYTLYGTAIMTAAGVLLGGLLYVASRFFAVETDARIEQILELLPGANCGACGFGGCAAFAEAVVLKGTACNLCAPGGADCTAAIARIMGTEAAAAEPVVAVLHCGGSCEVAKEQAAYYGIGTCRAACVDGVNSPKACLYGCLALGDCIRACPFDAIVSGADGLPQIIESRCVGCGKCVAACPRSIIELHTRQSYVHVLCKSPDTGREVRGICAVGCIGCRRCEKACEFGAIHVVDNLAIIDYAKCTSCGKCTLVCPTNTIVDLQTARTQLAAAAAEEA